MICLGTGDSLNILLSDASKKTSEQLNKAGKIIFLEAHSREGLKVCSSAGS